MADSPQPASAGNARYHAVAATALWADFVAGLAGTVVRSLPERLRADNERKRETTYARGELGRH